MFRESRGENHAPERLAGTTTATLPSPNHSGRSCRPSFPQPPGLQIGSDITYIPTREGWLYLAIVIDLYSRTILGWKLSDSLHAQIVTQALQRALDTGWVAPNAIFHSDRGCQYTAGLTRDRFAQAGLRQSMSASGDCYDNAFAESAFASLKSELPGNGEPFVSKHAAATTLFDYLETFYNRKRLHSALGYSSPHTFLNQYFQSQKHCALHLHFFGGIPTRTLPKELEGSLPTIEEIESEFASTTAKPLRKKTSPKKD
jgi:transposase InsO family protein